MHERLFTPDIGPDFNPSSVYYDLASREYRGYKVVNEDGIERGGFAREKRDVRIAAGIEDEVIVPVSKYGFAMSPIEASTGVPLPVVSTTTGKGNRGGQDYHHAYFYDSLYARTLEHRAVRYSRLQLVPKWAHTRYHQHFDGTDYPEDEHAAFRVTILNCAGYVPSHGVYVNDKEAYVRPLKSRERQFLREPNSFVSERYENGLGIQRRSIGQFVMYYALSQYFDEARIRDVEEFLEITPEFIEKAPETRRPIWEERKRHLAMKLTNVAIHASVESVRPDFRRARDQLLLRRDLNVSDPWAIAKAQLAEKEPDYYETLEGLLVARHKLAA